MPRDQAHPDPYKAVTAATSWHAWRQHSRGTTIEGSRPGGHQELPGATTSSSHPQTDIN